MGRACFVFAVFSACVFISFVVSPGPQTVRARKGVARGRRRPGQGRGRGRGIGWRGEAPRRWRCWSTTAAKAAALESPNSRASRRPRGRGSRPRGPLLTVHSSLASWRNPSPRGGLGGGSLGAQKKGVAGPRTGSLETNFYYSSTFRASQEAFSPGRLQNTVREERPRAGKFRAPPVDPSAWN